MVPVDGYVVLVTRVQLVKGLAVVRGYEVVVLTVREQRRAKRGGRDLLQVQVVDVELGA